MTHPTNGSGGTTGPGRTASALTAERREDNYRRQNGTDRLTPRQRRRRDHKTERAKARSNA